jgi:hypothetical protein
MIKFLITSAAIIFFALAGVTYSKAAECQYGTTQQMLDKLSEIQGVQVQELKEHDVQTMIKKLGPPPGTDGIENIVIYRADKDQGAALFITQNGCLVNKIGPVPADALNNFLAKATGAVDAGLEFTWNYA